MRISTLVALTGVACAASELPTTSVATPDAAGLRQEVSLSATTVAVGDSITIRSVVRNVGTHPEPIELGGCGAATVAVSGVTFVARPDTAYCLDLTVDGPLAPGDSVVAERGTPPIASPPGEYVLSIREIDDQEVPARVTIRVVARAASGM